MVKIVNLLKDELNFLTLKIILCQCHSFYEILKRGIQY